MGKLLKFLIVLLLIIGLVAGGVYYWFNSADIHLQSALFPPIPWDDIKDRVPLLHPDYQTPKSVSAETQQVVQQTGNRLSSIVNSNKSREAQITDQLKNAGLPVTGVYILESPKGEPVLTITLDQLELTGSSYPMDAVVKCAQSLTEVSATKSINFSGMTYVTVAICDADGRIVFAASASIGDIERFRAGQLNRQQFLALTAAQFQNPGSAIDLLRGLVGK